MRAKELVVGLTSLVLIGGGCLVAVDLRGDGRDSEVREGERRTYLDAVAAVAVQVHAQVQPLQDAVDLFERDLVDEQAAADALVDGGAAGQLDALAKRLTALTVPVGLEERARPLPAAVVALARGSETLARRVASSTADDRAYATAVTGLQSAEKGWRDALGAVFDGAELPVAPVEGDGRGRPREVSSKAHYLLDVGPTCAAGVKDLNSITVEGDAGQQAVRLRGAAQTFRSATRTASLLVPASGDEGGAALQRDLATASDDVSAAVDALADAVEAGTTSPALVQRVDVLTARSNAAVARTDRYGSSTCATLLTVLKRRAG